MVFAPIPEYLRELFTHVYVHRQSHYKFYADVTDDVNKWVEEHPEDAHLEKLYRAHKALSSHSGHANNDMDELEDAIERIHGLEFSEHLLLEYANQKTDAIFARDNDFNEYFQFSPPSSSYSFLRIHSNVGDTALVDFLVGLVCMTSLCHQKLEELASRVNSNLIRPFICDGGDLRIVSEKGDTWVIEWSSHRKTGDTSRLNALYQVMALFQEILGKSEARAAFEIFALCLWGELKRISGEIVAKFAQSEDFGRLESRLVKLGYPVNFAEFMSKGELELGSHTEVLKAVRDVLLSSDHNIVKMDKPQGQRVASLKDIANCCRTCGRKEGWLRRRQKGRQRRRLQRCGSFARALLH